MIRTVWGFIVKQGKSGRTTWPPELKREAVRRIVEDRQGPAALAREIGVCDGVVRKWLKDERNRKAVPPPPAASFVEISVEENILSCPSDNPLPGNGHLQQSSTICISIGDLRMDVPPHLDGETVAKFIRALRAV